MCQLVVEPRKSGGIYRRLDCLSGLLRIARPRPGEGLSSDGEALLSGRTPEVDCPGVAVPVRLPPASVLKTMCYRRRM